ncbi:hypothetical protein DITRI_Ditri19aG0020700 [Diplodiscus trichospermus]
MVSDGTGWTAAHPVKAALGWFEHFLGDRGCPVNSHLFSGVILPWQSSKKACKLWGAPITLAVAAYTLDELKLLNLQLSRMMGLYL